MNYKKLIIVLFAVIIILLIPIIDANTIKKTNETGEKPDIISTIYGNTWYVGGNEPGNFSKIQDAIDNASYGDTVFVYDDSSPYNENLIINKTISLIGENKESTVINGDSERSVIVILEEYVHISGFSIQMTGPDEGTSGISILKNFSLVSDNIILNNDWGIYIYNSFFNSIIGNKFLNNDFGLSLQTSENIIKDNQFFNDGIYLISSGNIVENNTVNYKPLIYLENQENKTIEYECGQIILMNCNSITIQNQIISNTGVGIILSHCKNCIIENNSISESISGISITYSDNNIIKFNYVFSNRDYGIYLYRSDYNLLEHNTCKEIIHGRWDHHGILLSRSNNNTIQKNHLNNNKVGIELLYYSCDNTISENVISYNIYIGFKLYYYSERNTINGNYIIGNDRGGYLFGVSHNFITHNNFRNNDNDLILEIVQYLKFSFKKFPIIDGNYWDKNRIFLRIIWGDFTFIFVDAPFGGYFTIRLPFIDWNPAKEPYNTY